MCITKQNARSYVRRNKQAVARTAVHKWSSFRGKGICHTPRPLLRSYFRRRLIDSGFTPKMVSVQWRRKKASRPNLQNQKLQRSSQVYIDGGVSFSCTKSINYTVRFCSVLFILLLSAKFCFACIRMEKGPIGYGQRCDCFVV